jgi:hypothetical protein
VSRFLTELVAPVLLGLTTFAGPDGTCHAAEPSLAASHTTVTYPAQPGEIRFGPYHVRGQAYKIAGELQVIYGYPARVEFENGAYYIYVKVTKK